eukprot:Blabericola_migrator_1__10907@NODE_62_length_15736_cov_138_574510_g56_i0_p3_GENE_NODE_62_length_15736_cov_138_574510_g56_i0NODE_62_length_15736_cov_138_574510_g56_i0_p3_ORF_typecomplete_len767_score121_78Pkinase/PF00069_25/7_1e53Pkinase_Tyr/PF07714_17/3_9e26Kinaselike/PF14531_6/6_5e10Kdo/PF06293_14/1_6e06WaaY/PF06176_11/5_8e06Pkinase_fungal/PF17667_1/5_8e06RIO1/PF01163_22/7_1e05APH/PF01636_23/0_0016YrbLPhoP_reg/PF10707_9/0_0038FTA2/PF13095_6/7_7e03FTA2/PF13095_6/0_11_NODE_62_length_15736_cov_138
MDDYNPVQHSLPPPPKPHTHRHAHTLTPRDTTTAIRDKKKSFLPFVKPNSVGSAFKISQDSMVMQPHQVIPADSSTARLLEAERPYSPAETRHTLFSGGSVLKEPHTSLVCPSRGVRRITDDELRKLIQESKSPVYPARRRLDGYGSPLGSDYINDVDPGYTSERFAEGDMLLREHQAQARRIRAMGYMWWSLRKPEQFKEPGALAIELGLMRSPTMLEHRPPEVFGSSSVEQRGRAPHSLPPPHDEEMYATPASQSATSEPRRGPTTLSVASVRQIRDNSPGHTGRSSSPQFGNSPSSPTANPNAMDRLPPSPTMDETATTAMSPPGGAFSHRPSPPTNIEPDPVPSDVLEQIKRLKDQYAADKLDYEKTYCSGYSKLHRQGIRPSYAQHPKPDANVNEFFANRGKLSYFNLKVIFKPGRTGFEKNWQFKGLSDRTVAERYEIESSIGDSAFSQTYRARDLKLEPTNPRSNVCLKVIHNRKEFMDQSLDEIQVLNYLKHNKDSSLSRCLELLDVFYYKEHLFLVTELLGDNLYTFETKAHKLGGERYYSLGRIQKIAYQILEALRYIHGLGLIHSDLKPENVVMCDATIPTVKIIDFGSACFKTDEASPYVQSRAYRAPEIVLGLPYDEKIDMWSLGCILAELWTGTVLFQNNGVHSMLARIVSTIGPFPEFMAFKQRSLFFTNDGRLVKFASEESSNPRSRAEVFFPKRIPLRERLRTDDENFIAFLEALLQINPVKRMSANEALQHPWISRSRYKDGLQHSRD